jgi:hypothetical protein
MSCLPTAVRSQMLLQLIAHGRKQTGEEEFVCPGRNDPGDSFADDGTPCRCYKIWHIHVLLLSDSPLDQLRRGAGEAPPAGGQSQRHQRHSLAIAPGRTMARRRLTVRRHRIRLCSRSGSSPSHAGFSAVLSKMEVILKGSNSPRDAAFSVLASSALTCASVNGRNVRAASNA